MLVVGGVLGAFVFAAACWFLLGANAFQESGPIEAMSALGYALAAAIVLVSLMMGRVAASAHLNALLCAILLGALAARELDMHKSELFGSLTRSATYVDPTRPVSLRLLAALLVLTFVGAAGMLAWRTWRAWRTDRQAPDAVRNAAIGALALLAVAKSIDGLGRKLSDIGITLADRALVLVMYAEETLELAAPMILCACAVLLMSRRASRA